MHTLAVIDDDRRGMLRGFLDAVQLVDGREPLSEYKAMRLDGGHETVERLVVADSGAIIGYGQAAWHGAAEGAVGHWGLEVVVAPERRGDGVAGELIASLRSGLGDAGMLLWGSDQYVAAAAVTGGWQSTRKLNKMMRALPLDCPHETSPGVSIAGYRPGIDDEAWLEANNSSFAGHPENGALTIEDLRRRRSRSWFDPAGFLLAWDGDRVVGSCWTKLHDDAVGEIYIIGVIPEWSGRGLGTTLMCLGLDYLASVRHAERAMLFVEDDNERATRLYEELGFTVVETISAYAYNR
jgi:mycothiol synthase